MPPTTTTPDVPLDVHLAGSGEPLVLVHGSWSDHTTWSAVAPGLARSFRVLAYDRRGHGSSPRVVAGSRRDHEDDLATLIEGLGAGAAHVVATSFGGSIAVGLATRRPELVRSLVAHEPPLLSLAGDDPAIRQQLGAVEDTVRAVVERVRSGRLEEAARAFVEEVALGPGGWELLPPPLRATMVDNARTFLAEQQDPRWADVEPAALADLACPVLLTQGDTSPAWFGPIVAQLAAVIGTAQVHTFRGAGHAPHLSHPADVVATVTGFLTRASGRVPTPARPHRGDAMTSQQHRHHPPQPDARAVPAQRRVSLSTGVTLPYVEQGDPDGLPVVFLHGYSDSWRSWELLLEHLPATWRVLVPTQRGHGDASRPAGGYRLEDHVADLAAFLDALDVPAAVVVGHSGGSFTAQGFAVDHPGRTLALGLVGAFRAFHENPDVLGLWEEVRELADPVDPAFVRGFQEACVTGPLPAGYLDAIVAESLKLPARVWRDYLRGLIEASVPTERGTIDVPTVVLWGDADAFCPAGDQDALVEAIPASRLVTFAGVNHCPHWEAPARVAEELRALVAQVQPEALAVR